mmetsp:Transcript_18712/g.41518  ORF Transcript_18712/g.41518 Transcript_18712/m.41518 type:complete len:105 (-) Transcript_18712:78-392(-)
MEARAELDAVLGHFNFLLTRADKPEVDPTEAPAASPAKEPAQDVPMGPAAVEEVAPAPVAAPEVQAQQIVAEQKSFSGPLLDNQENAPANVLATGVVMAAVEQL